jgi:hypothetical protein
LENSDWRHTQLSQEYYMNVRRFLFYIIDKLILIIN